MAKRDSRGEKKGYIGKRLGGALFTLIELKNMFRETDTIEMLSEDWSGIDQISKTRPGRKINKLSNVFSPWEKLTILFTVFTKFGLKGLIYLIESAKKSASLYDNEAMGYYLIISRKR